MSMKYIVHSAKVKKETYNKYSYKKLTIFPETEGSKNGHLDFDVRLGRIKILKVKIWW